jgi:hypothetical protein
MRDSAEAREAREAGHSGEAAWRAAKEDVAARNAQARRIGRQQRQAHELQAARAREEFERREIAALIEKSKGG